MRGAHRLLRHCVDDEMSVSVYWLYVCVLPKVVCVRTVGFGELLRIVSNHGFEFG